MQGILKLKFTPLESPTIHSRVNFLMEFLLLLLVLSLFLSGPLTELCFSLPEVQEVVSGQVELSSPNPSTLNINASDKAIINYKSFDIKENESVVISLPAVDNELLNRVLGDSSSSILGKLSSNGIVILINQKGIFFGPNANVDVAGLIASTRDLSNSNFLSSKYVFEKLSKEQLDRLLLNQGNINISEEGFGVLIAGAIENSGTIVAPIGTIALASGDMVSLEIAGQGLISVAIDKEVANQVYDLNGKPVTEQIKNTGTLEASGGVVLLKAEALPGLFEKAINLEGYTRADRLTVAGESLSLNSQASLLEVYKKQDIRLTNSTLQDNLITLEGDGIRLTYIETNNLTLQTDNAIDTTPGVIIQANQLRLIAREFGSLNVPLNLQAKLTYINRVAGSIEIMQSQGIGTSIMLRGPPDLSANALVADGFGAITYLKDTELILESSENIIINSDVLITLTGDTTFRADSDQEGSGYFAMQPGSSIIGAGYSLTIYASENSTLRAITGVDSLSLQQSKTGSNPTYSAYSDLNLTNFSLNNSTFNAGSITLTLSGNLANQGTFQPGTSTVIFEDSLRTSSLTGSTTFYNFKSIAAGKRLIFETGSLTTIQNLLTLEGNQDNYISLESSLTGEGNEFNIYINYVSDAQGEPYVQYIRVSDSDAFGPIVPIPARNEDIAHRNNTGWDPTPVNVYYSVGQNTTDHSSGGNVSITSGVATFTVAQSATNLGVGDRLTAGGNVYYLASKTSTTVWNVVTNLGATPVDLASTAVTSIAHEYTSLSAAEAGASDANHLNTSDLVTGNYILNLPCYYDSAPDATVVTVDGWTTGSNNYINIYTPYNTSTEVNQSQRHTGKWTTTAYSLEPSVSAGSYYALYVLGTPDDGKDNHIRIDGLQIKVLGSSTYVGGIVFDALDNGADARVSNTIIQGSVSGSGKQQNNGIEFYVTSTATLRAWNNIIYNLTGGAVYEVAIWLSYSGGTIYAYNNTIYNCTQGLYRQTAGTFVAQNNIVKGSGNSNAYIGTFASGTDYNATDGTDDIGQGTHNRTSQTFSFINTTGGSEDLHLASNDAGAATYGIDLSADANLAFSTDLDNQTRSGTWDIGADELSAYWISGTGNWSNTAQWSTISGGASGQTVPASTTPVFFDANSGTGTATVDGAANALALDFTGYTGTFALSAGLSIYGNLTLVSGMTFTPNTQTVTFAATSGTNDIISASKSFQHVTFNDGGGTATFELEDAFDANGNLTITGGTLDTKSGENNSINVGGNWSNSDIFTSNTSEVTFDGSDNATINTGGTGTTQDFQTFTVNKSGAAYLQLTSNSLDVDGTITINSGATLDLNNLNIASATTISNSGTLKLTGDETLSVNPTNNAGSTVEYSATSGSRNIKDWTYVNLKINGSGGTFTLGAIENPSGTLNVTTGTFNDSGNALTVTGLVTVNGGTLTLSAANTFSSGITLSSGTLNINNATAIGAGTFTISGGTINNTSGGSITLSNNNAQAWNGDFTFTGSNALNLGTGAVTLGANRQVTVSASTLTVGGIISGAFSLTKAGANGTLTLSGANDYTGITTINAGTISIAADSGLGAVPGGATATAITFGGGTLTTTANFTLSTNRGMTLNAGGGTIDVASGTTLTYAGVITGAGALTKTSAGTLTLSGANTYSGGTTLSVGTLNINHTTAIGTGTLTTQGASVTIDNTSDSEITLSNNNAQAWNSNFTFTGTKDLNLGTGAVSILGGLRQVTVSAGTLTVGGVISGIGSKLSKLGAGTLILSGANEYTGGTNLNAGTLQFANGSLGSSGNIDFSGGTLQHGASNTQDLSSRIVNSSSAIAIDTNSNNVTFASIVDSTNTVGLTKSGAGTLTLSGVNTYTGDTTINAGTISISADSGLGGVPGSADANAITFGGGTLATTATFTLSTNRGMTLNAGGGTIDVASSTTLTYGGVITGSGALTKTSAGTLTLSGANDYTGITTINAGTISIAADSGLGAVPGGATATAITFGGGTLTTTASFTLSTNRGITLNAGGGSIDVADSTTLTYGGVITGAGALTKTSAGTLTLSGVNTYTGITTINAGIVSIAADSGLGAVPGGATATAITFGGGTLTTTASFTLSTNRGMTLNAGGGTISVNSGTTLTYAGVITGAGALTKQGAGTLSLSGVNTYTGITTIRVGTISIGADSGLGAVPGSVTATAITLGTALLSGTLATTADFTLSTNRGMTLNAGGGTIDVATDTTLTYGGVITGNGSLTKTSAGTLTLSGANTYIGGTYPNAGTLNFANGSLSSSGNIDFGGGTLQYGSGNTQDLSSRIVNSSSAIAIDTNSNNVTFASIVDSTNTAGLTKSGAGTLTLSAVNTYTGDTTINGGTISISADSGLGGVPGGADANSITFGGGTLATTATFTLSTNRGMTLNAGGGTIDVASSTTLTYGGVITGAGALAKSSAGTLSLSGANDFSGGATLSAGTLNINHATAIGSGTFTISGGTIDNTSGGSITLSNNNAQAWNGDFTFTGTNDLNLGAGAVTLGANRQVTVSASTLTVGGIISGAFSLTKAGANGTLTLSAANTHSGGTTLSAGTLYINNAQALGTSTFTITAGTFDANGQAATITGLTTVSGGEYKASTALQTLNAGLTISGGTFTGSSGSVDVNGNLSLSSGTLSAPSGSFTVSGNWSKTGGTFTPGTNSVTFDSTSSGKTITTGASSFYNLSFNGVGGEWTAQDNTTVSRNFTLTNGTFKLDTRTLTVSADFRVDGSFNAGTGKVVFNDATQVTHIYGTTFTDLEVTTAGKELQFEAGSTETITGGLTLTGAAGNLISLRSTTSGSQWNIDPQGTRLVSFVDVKDSNNISVIIIDPANSIDSGNNINWFPAVSGITESEVEESLKTSYASTTPTSTETPAPPEESQISLGTGESLVLSEYTTLFLCEDAPGGYKKCYPQGNYRTVVIVFEGKVVVAPYDESGKKDAESLTISSGQRTLQEAEVE